MQFNTILYLLFFTVATVLYWILPHKARVPLLLVASYVFYSVAGPKLLIYLVACTLITYIVGRLIQKNTDKENKKSAKALMIVGVVCDVAVLAVIKYTNFFIYMINKVSGVLGTSANLETFNIIVPLGISFITFQTISYMVDVYKQRGAAEKNLLKFAAYVSFFPIVVQGPIEKARDIIPQFDEKKKFDSEKLREGIIIVLFGLFIKLAVADRAAIIVNEVYGALTYYVGSDILFATIIFAIQIYADFAGYSLMAIGSAYILGINVNRNFRQPYMSTSVSEFWRRWHISLNTWLKDYLYIPLGGSRCSKPRKYFNTMVTFGVSGLWHGADLGYVIWGLLNGAYVCIENIFRDITGKEKRDKTAGEKKQAWLVIAIKRIFVFIFVSIAWLFFRARTLGDSLLAIKKIVFQFEPANFVEKVARMISMGEKGAMLDISIFHYIFFFISLIPLIFVDVYTSRHEEGLAKKLVKGNLVVRWIVLYALIFGIIILGAYGFGYEASSFIYTRF